MRKIKRRDGLTTSSNQRQRTWKQGGKTRILHLDYTFHEEPNSLSDSGEVVWHELGSELGSNLLESVVSLASFDGNTMHFACTGIVFKSSLNSAEFLTSASLIRSLDDESRIITSLTIKVRLPHNQVVDGWVQRYESDYNIVVITIKAIPDLCAARLRANKQGLNHHAQVESPCDVFAVSRSFNSGKLLATRGLLIDSPSGVHREELMLSTCQITEAWTGGPLVDFDGNIVGMNFYAREKMTPFVPTYRILECFGPQRILRVGSNQEGYSTRERTANEIQKSPIPYKYNFFSEELTDDQSNNLPPPWPCDDAFTDSVNLRLRSKGYTLPTFFDSGMYLKNTFEDEFGEDIWSEPAKKVSLKMSRSVVSLASFNGDARFFACTGVFIDCSGSTTNVLTSASLVRTSGDRDRIDHNLRIEVCLPSKRRAKGTLQHYNLCYNVAVVSIMGFRSHRAAKLDEAPQREVVALGRAFLSGKLMTTSGVVTDKPSRFDCKELKISTCKITKCGIGGPLVDFDGNFVGMNFYDTEETPYLPRNIILKLLRHFDAQQDVTAGIMDRCNYRWHVPEAFWHYPSLHDLHQVELGPEVLE